MKKFTEFKPNKIKKINEDVDDMVKANLPENIEGSENKENEESEKEALSKENVSVSKFFSKLFESREMAHIYHLQVKGGEGSHATHIALNDYYENVLEFVDDLIETYQGQFGLIEEYDVIDTKDTKSKEVVEYFNELASFIKEGRKCISDEDTHLHNIIDEVVALVYKTLYKLKYTK
jgi:hypothetical protein